MSKWVVVLIAALSVVPISASQAGDTAPKLRSFTLNGLKGATGWILKRVILEERCKQDPFCNLTEPKGDASPRVHLPDGPSLKEIIQEMRIEEETEPQGEKASK